MSIEETVGFRVIQEWMQSEGKTPFSFQQQTWDYYRQGFDGLVIAPTGFGKTFSVFLAVLIDFMNNPDTFRPGLQLLWISPLRSLAKDLARVMQTAINELGLDWTVETRHGDTDAKTKTRQTKYMPEVLLVTPESLHLLLAQKGRERFFETLRCVVVDEWHELLSTKRGVMTELAIAYLSHRWPKVRIWGITATIGNVDEAMEVLIPKGRKKILVRAKEKKKLEIIPVYPPELDILPWAGHMGAKMVDEVIPIIHQSKSTIIFTNTRGQSETWYQLLLDADPDLAGQMALHHSSIDAPIRQWIEEALSDGRLKAVVATSSLDLGVDFKPVDTVIQVGSSKGVARFMQRAGRSGHSPFETSKIYLVPTHSLELLEAAALNEAIHKQVVEPRVPMVQVFDVLIQFLVTLALGGGFHPDELFPVIAGTYCFQFITKEEWGWCIIFITQGGKIGAQYEEYHKVVRLPSGVLIVENRRIAMRHRMNIGVIISDAMLKVKLVSGGYVGSIEEYFISKLQPGQKFVLAGRVLELVRIKDMTVQVKKAKGKAIVPSWLGGRLPLSANLSAFLRTKMQEADNDRQKDEELKLLKPLIAKQKSISTIPKVDELLVEFIHTRDGYHMFVYPFEGRLIHEVMAPLLAYRISRIKPISFSMAMNDYGFELFSDTAFQLSEEELRQLLSPINLIEDVVASINAAELARRKFKDISVIAGMIFQQVPGRQKSNKSLQASSSTIFRVLEEYDSDNLLLRQAYAEVFNQQLEELRLRAVFDRISKSRIILTFAHEYTPLCFPIKVDSLRQSLSSEELEARILRLLNPSKKTKK